MTEIKLIRSGEEPFASLRRCLPRGTIDTSLKVFVPDRVLAEFTDRFPGVLALFEQVGIHPVKATTPRNPYTGEPACESFSNIGEHCLAVGHAARQMMDTLVVSGVASEKDADLVIERALVHDITKPYEIMRRDAQKAGLSEEVYSISAYERLQPLLVQSGVSKELADYLVQAGKETGHNSLKNFLVTNGQECIGIIPGKIAEKIVHLADDITFTSTPVHPGEAPVTLFLTPWERMLASRFIEKYPWMWSEGLGVNEAGEIVEVRNVESPSEGVVVLGDYAALQVKVAGAIAQQFQKLLDPASRREPEDFIKALVNEASR